MYSAIKDQLQHELDEIRSAGLFKTERHIDSPQANHIKAGQIGESGADVLNFCANNYLGLADLPGLDAVGLRRVDVPLGLEQAGAADLIEFVLQLVLDG